MKYRLGLDIGTNSIGWAVLDLDNPETHSRIVSAGVRIFSDGRDPQSKSTLKATRREARSARRRRDRYIQRRTFLLDELTTHGLFPQDVDERYKLQLLNPLKIRATALTQEVPLFHLGRALFHLNQRRGFKSNRKDRSEEVTSGKVSQSSRKLLEQMGLVEAQQEVVNEQELTRQEISLARKEARRQAALERQEAIHYLREKDDLTFGSFLWERHQQGLTTRARPNSDSKLYDIYPTRELLEDEFEKIWNAQAEFYPDKLTHQLKDHFFNIIFRQRKLKPQPLGKCIYLPEEDRVHRAMPSFQRYRILQEVNNLEWRHHVGVEKLIEDRLDRDVIIYLLEHPSIKSKPTHKNAMISFKKIRTELKRREAKIDDTCDFNLESERRKGLEGNTTSNVMQHEDYVGDQWHSWTLEKQDEFISIILDDELDDLEVSAKLVQDFELTPSAAEMCKNANLADGTANISFKAARILSELMEQEMLIQSDAVILASEDISQFQNPYRNLGQAKLLPELPYYGLVVKGHIIPGSPTASDEQSKIGMVSNPTVHIAMNQLRLVINELIRRFGLPHSISIELARDLPAGKEQRSEINFEQTLNQKKNEEYDQKLTEFGQDTNRTNRLLMRLWEEQDKRCVFTGKIIGLADLFSGDIEIEHLIPFSRSLDDSVSNKVVCTRQANRDKGNRTPFEAFSQNPGDYVWEEIYQRVKDLPKPKQWRFDEDALEKWEKGSEGDFTSRHLNDTRYISRLAKEYLENICSFNKIDVVTGRLTALLRRHWGLNGILSELNEVRNRTEHKNRNDHRHHAIDAVVVGMTTRSMLQKVSTEANRAEDLSDLHRLFQSSSRESRIDPWSGFRADVKSAIEKITVSHKVRHKQLPQSSVSNKDKSRSVTDGQLHNDTAYGVVKGPDEKGHSTVVVRWPIEKFKSIKDIDSIRDERLRSLFRDAYSKDPKDGVTALAGSMGIRRLRRIERLKVIPIENCAGEVYKAYKGDSNWGLEIFEYPKGHAKAGRWEGVVISTFDANQISFQPGVTFRPHPAAKLVMRLHINDCIEVDDNAKKRIMRLQKMSRTGSLSFTLTNEANVDSRNRDRDDSFAYWTKQVGVLKKLNARKLHVSPAGHISYAK